MSLDQVTEYAYIGAAVLFIFGLKMLSKPGTARRGNLLSSLGMLVAIVATLLAKGMSYQWIVVGAIVGSLGAVRSVRQVVDQLIDEFLDAVEWLNSLLPE